MTPDQLKHEEQIRFFFENWLRQYQLDNLIMLDKVSIILENGSVKRVKIVMK